MAIENYPSSNSNNQNIDNASKLKNKAVIILPILFLIIIIFSLWQFVVKVNSPFQFRGDVNSALIGSQNKSAQNLDTDRDGISDYDEVFVYKTSPYIEDTDSDSLSDYDEIFSRKTDPNCPEGQKCFSADDFAMTIPATSTGAIIEAISEVPETGLGNINLSQDVDEAELKRALAGEMDATTLRQLLIDSGADIEVLNQVSDEDLLASYQEVLNNQNEN